MTPAYLDTMYPGNTCAYFLCSKFAFYKSRSMWENRGLLMVFFDIPFLTFVPTGTSLRGLQRHRVRNLTVKVYVFQHPYLGFIISKTCLHIATLETG